MPGSLSSRSISRWIPIAAAFFVFAGCSGSGDPYTDLPDPLFANYQGDQVPGASVLVVSKGDIIQEEVFGMAHLEESRRVTPETNFRLASVTKQFTAMGIMMLVEEGSLALDQSIRTVFPELPAFMEAITVQHLLQHQSGLQDYESLVPDGFEGQVVDSDVLDIMVGTQDLRFSPGTDYSYSNSGYALLALIIERISGQSFDGFLDARIFTPLEMDGTVAFTDGVNDVSNRAYGYTVDSSGVSFSDQSSTSAVLGDGGIYSSIRDLYKWDQALYGDALVSAEMMTKAWTPGLSNYGFGWRIQTVNGHRRLSHTGSSRGFRTVIHRFPDAELTIVILTNRNGPAVADLAEQIAVRHLPSN